MKPSFSFMIVFASEVCKCHYHLPQTLQVAVLGISYLFLDLAFLESLDSVSAITEANYREKKIEF